MGSMGMGMGLGMGMGMAAGLPPMGMMSRGMMGPRPDLMPGAPWSLPLFLVSLQAGRGHSTFGWLIAGSMMGPGMLPPGDIMGMGMGMGMGFGMGMPAPGALGMGFGFDTPGWQ